jgi:STE24 endopeptidase
MPIVLIVFIVAATGWSVLSIMLSVRQIDHVRAHRDKVPADFAAPGAPNGVTLEEHRRAADYTVARERLGIASTVISLAISLAWVLGGIDFLYGGLGAVLAPSLGLGVAFLVAVTAIGSVLELPLEVYGTFVLEQRFGFNRTTPATFVADRLKRWVISAAVAVPLLFACLWAMHALAGLWWLWTWFGLLAIMVAAPTVYVRLIAPRFNRFTPLAEGVLRSRIEGLLARCGFRSSGLFSMDASRRSAHGNAFFIGFGRAKRIVLFDTLLDRSTPDEVEAVVAHELGHFRHGHVLLGLLRSAVVTFVALAAFGWLTARQDWLLASFGITHRGDALALLACLLLYGVVGPLAAPLSNYLSRRNEFQADEYARRHVGAAPMVSALVKLSRDNASTLTPDPVYALVHYSHPPVPLRVRQLRLSEAAGAPGRTLAAAE